ncbi:MAG: lipoyl synthase [Bacillota bacterium]
MMHTGFPDWLKKRVSSHGSTESTRNLIAGLGLGTVCKSAACPNQAECFSLGTATFLILGETCTRKCSFCAVKKGIPAAPDTEEPCKLARAVAGLGLKHAVITSVTRDDMPDGGASHFVKTINTIREISSGVTVEVLTPDFMGLPGAVDMVASAYPEVFGHNIETVPRLYRQVRPGAEYKRSLAVLERVKYRQPGAVTKSGLMVGLGEHFSEISQVMSDLRSAGCDIITIGQYLRPTRGHIEVKDYVRPETFEEYRQAALEAGFRHALCGPFVRSSYRAGEYVIKMKGQ